MFTPHFAFFLQQSTEDKDINALVLLLFLHKRTSPLRSNDLILQGSLCAHLSILTDKRESRDKKLGEFQKVLRVFSKVLRDFLEKVGGFDAHSRRFLVNNRKTFALLSQKERKHLDGRQGNPNFVLIPIEDFPLQTFTKTT